MQDDVKQIIVWRNDLKGVPKGKFGAQIAHASIAFLTNKIRAVPHLRLSDAEQEWIDGPFKKIVCYVKSEEELVALDKRAKDMGITSYLITDSGFTVFTEPTVTCLGLGPDYAHALDPLTKDLPLL